MINLKKEEKQEKYLKLAREEKQIALAETIKDTVKWYIVESVGNSNFWYLIKKYKCCHFEIQKFVGTRKIGKNKRINKKTFVNMYSAKSINSIVLSH